VHSKYCKIQQKIDKNNIKLKKKTRQNWNIYALLPPAQKMTCFGNSLFHNISFIIKKFGSILYSSSDLSTDHPF
jgi:hypothetical protein